MSLHERFTLDVDRTPRFTACYLRVAGDECAFVEAHTVHALPRLMAALAERKRKPQDVRWIIVTHAHLDHAAGAGALAAACPRATVVAHPRTAKHLVQPERLVEGALAVYGHARFADLYGSVTPIAKDRVRALADGESIELGGAKLTGWHTYGHAFHHMVVDDPEVGSVYTGDAFGLVYPALQQFGRFALPSTSPTGFHYEEAKTSLQKVLSLGERTVCLTHFDGHSDAAAIAVQVERFLARAEAWVEAESLGDDPASVIQARLEGAWRNAIQEEAPRFGPAEMSLLALDVELNAQGLTHAALARRAERKQGATSTVRQ